MNISTLHPRATSHSMIGSMVFLLLLISFMMISNLYAADVSLTWNKNDESDLAGYNIYQRLLSTNDYGSPVFSGFPSNPSAPQHTITGLLAGTTYEFIGTAFDSSGNESTPAPEQQITTGGGGGGSGGGVTISNLTPVSYAVVPASPGVQVGGLIYIDRSRTFSSVPASVQGATYIQTANDDKAATANPFLSFTVDQSVTVYVAHDARISLPAWLTNMGFTDTGENLVSSGTPFDLFAQTFPAGPITLGGNESGGCCMMYSVIVQAASGGGGSGGGSSPDLTDDFADGNFTGWQVIDEGTKFAPSAWAVVSGRLQQTSNIYNNPTGTASLPKQGTFAWFTNGLSWRDYRLAVQIESANDDDALGVMVRYQDPNNYYRFSWDSSRTYRRLVKVVNGTFTLLATEAVPYVIGQTYQLDVIVEGNTLEVRVDGAALFGGPITDSAFAIGSVALYSWANENSIFDNVIVEAVN